MFLLTAPPDGCFDCPVGVEALTAPSAATAASPHDYVELAFTVEASKLIVDCPTVGPGQHVVMQIYATGARSMVVENDTDILTHAELKEHETAVCEAMLLELQTWLKYGCFDRKSRKLARNIIDCRWVVKWKFVIDADGIRTRTIRCRLTVRGFKDIEAQGMEAFSGTCSRWGQRLITAQAALHHWPLVTADVEKAFLQGVSYEELAKETGAPIREVNFELPKNSVLLLRQLPGLCRFLSSS